MKIKQNKYLFHIYIMIRTHDQDYRLTAQATGTVQDLTYGLDTANNITAITNNLDGSRSQGFSYDPLNRLTDASGIYGTLAYTYDATGNRQTKSLDGGPFKSYTYGYEDPGQPDSHRLLETVNGGTVTYSYDESGNTTDNTAHGFIYGDNNRLKTAQISGVDVATYTYNGRGERVGKTDTNTTYYHYDQGGQLLAETGAEGETLKEYVYLEGMPIALIDVSNSDGAATVLDNDSCGTVMNGDWSATATVMGFEGTDYRQSPAGSGQNRYHWLCAGVPAGKYRLYAKWTAAPDRATDAPYTIEHSSGSTTINASQQQDGGQFNLVGTYDLDQTSRISLSDQADGIVVADAVKLVPTTITVTVSYIHGDHLNTPQVITDNNQQVVWKADYDPFGKATITTELITNNLRFPGQYFDSETNLDYNYFRTYDPSIGRYIESDPIGLRGGLNTYGYVGNNPIFYIDPFGLDGTLVIQPHGITFSPSGNPVQFGTVNFTDAKGNVYSAPYRSGAPRPDGSGLDPTVPNAGPTPPGEYEATTSPVPAPKGSAFCIGNDCWFLPYGAQFQTPNGRCPDNPPGRCGLHPEGGAFGTKGCTGLTANTSVIRDAIIKSKPTSTNPITVIVQF